MLLGSNLDSVLVYTSHARVFVILSIQPLFYHNSCLVQTLKQTVAMYLYTLEVILNCHREKKVVSSANCDKSIFRQGFLFRVCFYFGVPLVKEFRHKLKTNTETVDPLVQYLSLHQTTQNIVHSQTCKPLYLHKMLKSTFKYLV